MGTICSLHCDCGTILWASVAGDQIHLACLYFSPIHRLKLNENCIEEISMDKSETV